MSSIMPQTAVFFWVLQGRLSFSNPFKRASAPPPRDPSSQAADEPSQHSPEPGSVPLANLPQSSQGQASNQYRSSSAQPGLVPHAPRCNGTLDHAQAASLNAGSASPAKHGQSQPASAQKPPTPQGFMRFFSRQATRRGPGLQPLPEQGSDLGSSSSSSSSSKQNGLESQPPASPSAGRARRRGVRFSPEKPPAQHSTTPDRISLHGMERRSDAGAHLGTARCGCSKLLKRALHFRLLYTDWHSHLYRMLCFSYQFAWLPSPKVQVKMNMGKQIAALETA